MILDIFSRYVVVLTVAALESAEIAKQLMANAITTQGRPGSLHADRSARWAQAGRAAAGGSRGGSVTIAAIDLE